MEFYVNNDCCVKIRGGPFIAKYDCNASAQGNQSIFWLLPFNLTLASYQEIYFCTTFSGGSRIFPRGGREPSRGGVNTPNFPENCMKSKEFGRPGGGVRPSRPPLDPPMSLLVHYQMNSNPKGHILICISCGECNRKMIMFPGRSYNSYSNYTSPVAKVGNIHIIFISKTLSSFLYLP